MDLFLHDAELDRLLSASQSPTARYMQTLLAEKGDRTRFTLSPSGRE